MIPGILARLNYCKSSLGRVMGVDSLSGILKEKMGGFCRTIYRQNFILFCLTTTKQLSSNSLFEENQTLLLLNS